MYKSYEHYLLSLQSSNQHRRLGTTRQDNLPYFLDFSTNDYLNLSKNPKLIKAATLSGQDYGVGSTGSRLLSGNLDLYVKFEKKIAQDKHCASSLIFNSGFQANNSVLSSLLDEKTLQARPLIFFDKLNHSSLYQAAFLSKGDLHRYRHTDMNHLESLLKKYKHDSRPKFIVTETVFGMEGDYAPLEHIVNLALHHNAFLYLDEAHATGVFGLHGYGLSTLIDLQHIPYMIMGTFSKAIGVSGGYVACSSILRDFIINKAPGFIYSTAPSPVVVGAAFKAWKLVKSLSKEREILQNLGATLRTMLSDNGFDIGTSQSHIVPIILQEEKACLRAQKILLDEKIIVSCIRPPTVPPKSARLRISLTAHHQLEDLEKLVETLKKAIQ